MLLYPDTSHFPFKKGLVNIGEHYGLAYCAGHRYH